MKENQKKSLMSRLFGKNVSPNFKPKCLFSEEWECEKRKVYYRLANVIVSLLPEPDREFELIQRVASYLSWSCPDAIKPWIEANPEPQLDRDAFLHYLCEQMLEKEGEEEVL